jgi:hypothetical protein
MQMILSKKCRLVKVKRAHLCWVSAYDPANNRVHRHQLCKPDLAA